jgi:hypothetical protein
VTAHIVLFTPRADLTAEERDDLVRAFAVATENIPSLRRSRVGRRVTHGRPYEQLMREHYEYAAVLEFDDVGGLKAYLEHPAHGTLGELFFSSCDAVLVYDFELGSGLSDLSARPMGRGGP